MIENGDDSDHDLPSLIEGVRNGDKQALGYVFDRYFARLVAFAQERMYHRQYAGDGEGAAASAMRSFVRCACAGRFVALQNQQELYRLLIVIVLRKAIKYSKRDRRYVNVSDADDVSSSGNPLQVHSFPTSAIAEQALFVHETLDQLLDALGKEVLQNVVLLQLEGHANPYIAEALCISIRSVQRYILQIRETLTQIDNADRNA